MASHHSDKDCSRLLAVPLPKNDYDPTPGGVGRESTYDSSLLTSPSPNDPTVEGTSPTSSDTLSTEAFLGHATSCSTLQQCDSYKAHLPSHPSAEDMDERGAKGRGRSASGALPLSTLSSVNTDSIVTRWVAYPSSDILPTGTVVGVRSVQSPPSTPSCSSSSTASSDVVADLDTTGCYTPNGWVAVVGEHDPSSSTTSVPVCLSGVAPVRVSTNMAPGTWLVPSGEGNGVAKKGTAGDQQVLGCVVRMTDSGLALVRLVDRSARLPHIMAAPYTSSEVEFQELRRVSRAPMIFFAIVALLILGGCIAVLLEVLPHHGDVSYYLTCNTTRAMMCAVESGEFDNECHAYSAGIANTRRRCCSSPAAYACFQQALCPLDCSAMIGEQHIDIASPMTKQEVGQAIRSSLGLSMGGVEVVALTPCANGTGCADEATVIFPSLDLTSSPQPAANIFLREGGTLHSKLRTALQATYVPWGDGGPPVAASILVNGMFSVLNASSPHVPAYWEGDGPCSIMTSQRDCASNSSCLHCGNGTSPRIHQTVDVAAYPPGMQWSLSGQYSTRTGKDSNPVVALHFVDSWGNPLGTQTPSMLTPSRSNLWFPKYLPFSWTGHLPDGTTTLRIEIGCKGQCDVYYDTVVLTPTPPPCNGTKDCYPLRCAGPFNQTHNLCETIRACPAPSPTPFSVPSRNMLDHFWLGMRFDEVQSRIGASLTGAVNTNQSYPPSRIEVHNEDGSPVPAACSSGHSACNNTGTGYKFRYQFQFASNVSDIPPKMHNWIVGDTESGFCFQLHWYVVKHNPHVMDVTVNPYSDFPPSTVLTRNSRP